MTTSRSRRYVPTVSRTNTQTCPPISRGVNRLQAFNRRYTVVSDKLVITLCMSSLDELSFGSILTRSVLAAAELERDPTATTVTISNRMRRMAPLSPWIRTERSVVGGPGSTQRLLRRTADSREKRVTVLGPHRTWS